MQTDRCGICGGDGTKCKERSKEFEAKVSSFGNTKLAIVPAGARNIKISLSSKQVLKQKYSTCVVRKARLRPKNESHFYRKK